MSSYPHNPSYGTNPNPSYLSPAYPNQYLQQPDDGRTGHGQMANSYDTNMNAFAYNRNAPTFSPAAVASGVPPLPIFQGWNQDAMPLPSYTASQSGGQNNNGYGENVKSQQYYPPPVQPSYQQQSHGFQNKSYEHDLDEGEFDDGAAANNNQPLGYSTTQYRGNEGTGYIDTAQCALFPRTQEYSPQQSYPANNYNLPQRDQARTRRQPSGSYSPYAAATAPSKAERPSGAHHQSSYSQGQLQESIVPLPIVPAPVAVPAKPFNLPQKSAQQAEPRSIPNKPYPSQNGAKPIQRATQAASVQTTISAVSKGADQVFSKSIAEERKSAQGAILKAWPLGIRLKAYVEEGIQEDVVKRLFIESNLSQSSNESSNGLENGGVMQVEETRAFQQQNPSLQALPTPQNGFLADASRTSKTYPTAIPPLSVTTNGNMVAKALTAQTPTDQVPTPTAAAPKSVSMIEKDKALKSKMDALKKSREERAQKAAARSVPSLIVPAVAANQVDIPKGLPDKAAVLEPNSAHATNSLSKSSSVPKNDLRLPAKPSFITDQLVPEPAIKPAPIHHQLPAIPGLFLASSASTPAPQIPTRSAVQSPVQGGQRKRPVAADFDEPVSSMATFKRPFGQNRNDKPLVIDVSEDEIDSEDEDVAMDLESVADDTPAQPTRKYSDNSLSTAQNQPAYSSSNQPKPWSPPAFPSASSMPPASQQISRSLPALSEGTLEQKVIQIEELKKKIAEAEAKKKTKRTNSGAQTPRAIETAPVETNSITQINGVIPTQQVPMLSQQLPISEEEKAANEQRKQAELRAVNTAKLSEQKRFTAEQNRITVEQKRMQRIKMANAIADLRAEDERKLQDIERRRAEVEQMEALRVQNLEDQRRLEEQMLLLAEEEEEGEHSSQVSEFVLNDALETPIVEAQASHVLDHPVISNLGEIEEISASTSEQNTDKELPDAAAAESAKTIVAESKDVENITQVNGVSSLASDGHSTSANGIHQSGDHADISRPASEDRMDDSKSSLSADQSLEPALQEAARIKADSHARSEEDTDVDISCTAEPAELQEPISDAIISDTIEEAPNSPEYSPELHRDIPDVPYIPDRESDDYEPPEATPSDEPAPIDEVMDTPHVVSSSFPIDSPPFSPAPPVNAPEPSEDMVLDVDSIHTPVEKASETEISSYHIQVAEASPIQMIETRDEPAEGARAFIPYESPLKNFRAYRFHPQFKQEIPGGWRSMTYSHRINPNKELCRYELAGGICNDGTCDLQHFREIGLPDDAVLTALGSPDEFQGEQRERFCVGLKEVLMRMRLNRVRDFNMIASEIIAHRAKFIGDGSKVLPLEGTNI